MRRKQALYQTRSERPGPKPKNQAEVLKAVKEGRLWMERPWGDWVRCRIRKPGRAYDGRVTVFMENDVEATIGRWEQLTGYQGTAIV